MANKVLSIKMDEKDIERLKKYYKALIKSGFLSSENMSLNGFYKHLLLDYLEEDVCRAFRIYSHFGISPRYINPEELDRDNGSLKLNTYNLDDDSFKNYKKCMKEELNRVIDELNNTVELFNEVVKTEIFVEEGWLYEIKCRPSTDMKSEQTSFWEDKAYERMELEEKYFKENEIQGDIEVIEKSSIPEELKQKLISEIEQYDKKRKLNYSITHGGRITK